MVHYRWIVFATALAMLVGAAAAETTRLSVMDGPFPPDDRAEPSALTLADSIEIDTSDDASQPDVPQSSIAVKVESSPAISLPGIEMLAYDEESIAPEVDWMLWEDTEVVNPFIDSNVQAAAYQGELAEPEPSSTQSPKSSQACRLCNDPAYGLALRGGWWDVHSEGAKTKIGEFESLQSSPFWDADGLYTDGHKTMDFSVTGLDSEGTDASLRYYGPQISANVEYQRFLRRLDHDPLNGIADSQQQPPGGIIVTKDDLNVGEDYAIRVQELNANFKGDLTENLKWRLGIWGMRKKGARQVNAMGHCFSHPDAADTNGNPVFGPSCHVLTQRQRIDWITTEIEPALEATVGSATVTYARTMRAFDQDDQVTTRSYDNFGGFFGGDLPYAVVPENLTEIDRLTSNVSLLPNWDFYSSYYTGNTKNKHRDTNRRLSGLDVRTTVRRGASASLTGFAKKNVQTGQLPAVLLPEENASDLNAPINYDQTTAGIKGRWRPFYGDGSWRNGLRFSGGYEYRGLARENAIFTEGNTTVNQSQTTANLTHIRAAMKWNSEFESRLRYRLGFVDNPLFGIAKNGVTNTNLPTQEHLVELGGTWTPADNLLLSGSFGFENRWNTSDISDFQEDSYPITLTGWYAPLDRWTLSGGVAFFKSWIDQDITLGGLSDALTSRWDYSGSSDVVNVGTTYAWTDSLTLSGGFAFVRGSNRFSAATIPYELSQFSEVLVETTRWTAGLDYQFLSRANFYFRYQFFDYDDKSQGLDSGVANMFLTGVDAVF
jgi:hypothetical protein